MYFFEHFEKPASPEMGERTAGFIEGYAKALRDVMQNSKIGACEGYGKSYDPMSVDELNGKMHSYMFDMKDGGRHHLFSDYDDVGDICYTLFQEAMSDISESLGL